MIALLESVGGKDSTFQAVYAKEKLGLHPLLVNCALDEITEVGRENIDNLNRLGFDIISIRPDPQIAKSLARKSFFERGNIVAASEYCLWTSSYIIADKFVNRRIFTKVNDKWIPKFSVGVYYDE